MITPIIYAIVRDGELKILNDDMYRKLLMSLEGREVDVVIKKHTYTRTSAENRYYWGVVVDLIWKDMHLADPEEAHAFLKSKFLSEGAEVTLSNGQVVRWTVIKESKTLSIPDFEAYCENCRTWAMTELNLNIPLPNEVVIN